MKLVVHKIIELLQVLNPPDAKKVLSKVQVSPGTYDVEIADNPLVKSIGIKWLKLKGTNVGASVKYIERFDSTMIEIGDEGATDRKNVERVFDSSLEPVV